MRVTNGEIWLATTPPADGETKETPLQSLMAEKWPVKTQYWLAKLARKLGEVRADVDSVRQTLIRQYGTILENGQIGVRTDAPDWPQFVTAFNELMAQTAEVDVQPVVLPDIESCQVTGDVMAALLPFVEMVDFPEPVSGEVNA